MGEMNFEVKLLYEEKEQEDDCVVRRKTTIEVSKVERGRGIHEITLITQGQNRHSTMTMNGESVDFEF